MGPNGVCSRAAAAAAAVDPARADQQRRRRSALLHYEGEERAGATLATGTMDGTAGVRYGGWGRSAVWHLILGI